jgi:tRNA (guanine37-N1)-methyltransferase
MGETNVKDMSMVFNISVVTLFPQSILPYMQHSIVGRAQQQGQLHVQCIDPRTFATNKHRKVDDTPYGGGAGMVMQCQPLDDALASLQPVPPTTQWIITSPNGVPFTQALANQWATQCSGLIIVCGHYEGIDDRLLTLYPQLLPVTVGPYVLTGGELPACIMTDAVARLLPGVVGNPESLIEESHQQEGWLEYPHYTRPASYKGLEVPPVLLQGNHKAIDQWRQAHSRQIPALPHDQPT